jgi:hypothetical protein
MSTHHISLYDEENNPAPAKGLKQELITWEETDVGFRLAKLCRSHSLDGHYDTFSSEHVLHSGLEEQLEAEQAFDIARGVDELLNPKP